MNPGEIFCEAGDIEINAGRATLKVKVANTGDRPIQVGSHYHFFETNKALRFDRAPTKGFRLNIAAGTAVRFEPGQEREVDAGRVRRRARGVRLRREDHGEAAMTRIDRRAYAEMYGPTTGDRVRLGDTELIIEVERDHTIYGEEVKFGGGKVIRDGMGQSQRGAKEVADTVITNALIVDHWGIVKADIGLKEGRIAGIGKAGNPDVQPGVDIIIGAGTEIIAGEGLIATAGGIDSHIHFICPQQVDDAMMSGITTMIGGGTGPAAGTSATTCTPGPWYIGRMYQALEELPINFGLLGKGNASLPAPLDEQIEAGVMGLKLHEDWGTTPAAIDNCLNVAEKYDIQVAIHTDTLNESGFLEDTLAAFKGRAIHTYHTEGAGGGHAPDIIKACGEANVLPSSTNPTRPVHGEHRRRASRHAHGVPPPRSRHRRGRRLRRVAHPPRDHRRRRHPARPGRDVDDLLGLAGHGPHRRSDHAHLADRAQDEGAARAADAGQRRATTTSACGATSPNTPSTRRSPTASRTKSAPSRRASSPTSCCGSPAFFGAKTAMIIKGGMIVAAPMGDPERVHPTPQPVHYRPMFGALAGARAATCVSFVSKAGVDERHGREVRPEEAPGGGAEHARDPQEGSHPQRLSAENRSGLADLRGARRRRAAALRAGERAAAGAAVFPVLTGMSCSRSISNWIAPLDHPRAAERKLVLPFGERSKSRLRAVLDNGEEAGLFLERGSVLRHGDLLLADDGRVIEVQAASETVSTVHTADALDAGARQLSPGQPARGAADRHRLAALPARSRARRHAARIRPRSRDRAVAVRTRRRRVCRGLASRARALASALICRRRRARPRRRIAAAAAPVAPGEPGVADRRVSFLAGPRIRGRARMGDRRSQALEWIGGICDASLGTLDLPVLARLQAAWKQEDHGSVLRWNAFLIACRETEELRAEDRHLGARCCACSSSSSSRPSSFPRTRRRASVGVSHATAFALAGARWSIDPQACLQTYAWAWIENQVLAAVKLVPLGQSAAQRMLHALIARIPPLVERVQKLTDSDIGIATALNAVASGRHETQYSRLFRS